MYQIKPRKIVVNTITAKTDNSTDTSDIPKKAQRKPEIRYIAGLNILIVCQALGSISIE